MSQPVIEAEIKLIDQDFDSIRAFLVERHQKTPEQMWFANLLTALLNSTLREYRHLKIGFEKYTGLLAWATRNLLELYIFTQYVLVSEDNARRFVGDRLIDGLEIFESFRAWQIVINCEADTTAVDETISMARAQMDVEGVSGQKFLKTSALAKAVGMEVEYAHFNKVCSKLVHPTAWSVLAMNDEGELDQMRPILFFAGARYGSDIGYRVREHIRTHGEKPTPKE